MAPEFNNKPLRVLAEKAARDPLFCGSDFLLYRESEGISEQELAELLGCNLDDLLRMSLCFKPDSSKSSFISDIHKIATSFGIDTNSLLKMLRHVDSLRSFAEAPPAVLSGHTGVLMAARSRHKHSQKRNRPKKK